MKIKPFEDCGTSKDDEVSVYVDEVSIKYTQDSDCCESEDLGQTITLTTRNNGISRFVHIQTDGWSIDSPDELVRIIEDFAKRAGLTDAAE